MVFFFMVGAALRFFFGLRGDIRLFFFYILKVPYDKKTQNFYNIAIDHIFPISKSLSCLSLS